MKFDAVVGNPPYQLVIKKRKNQPSIYNYFLDLGYMLGRKVSMIHPARFLFNAGSTPKDWNKKMLNDVHLKIQYFEQNSSLIFPNTDIKGGIAISYWDEDKIYGPIGLFTPYPELNTILKKVNRKKNKSLSDIFYSNTSYKYNDLLYKDHPYLLGRVSGGSVRYLASSVFEKFSEVLVDVEPQDGYSYAKINGRLNGKRVVRFMREDYLIPPDNYKKYKVFVAASNGSGILGEELSTPFVGNPGEGATETFMSLGSFDEKKQAINLLKYLKTKFFRTMLGSLKITQSNKSKDVWQNVPLLDFSDKTDVDWNKSISEIDKQLYGKYGLNTNEVIFIDNKVKNIK